LNGYPRANVLEITKGPDTHSQGERREEKKIFHLKKKGYGRKSLSLMHSQWGWPTRVTQPFLFGFVCAYFSLVAI
jgi:hypothetical protein